MGETTIQWTNRSLNPLRARLPGSTSPRTGHYCEKISPGCRNCYSSRMQPRFGLPQFQEQRRVGVDTFLDPKPLLEVLRRKKPTKWFWCDMTDMFGDWVRFDDIAILFGVMAATPHHTHQVLTKRPARARDWFSWMARRDLVGDGVNAAITDMFGVPMLNEYLTRNDSREGCDPGENDHLIEFPPEWPLPNVHFGVSAENQQTFDARWRDLRCIPAAVRWFSLEPMIDGIDVGQAVARFCGCSQAAEPSPCDAWNTKRGCPSAPPRADWFVIGGESGQKARGFDIGWARQIVAQCKAAGVPAFVKQLGRRPRDSMDDIRGGYGDANAPLDLSREVVQLARDQPGPEWTRVVEQDRAQWIRYLHLEDSHGGDPAEWPEDLRVREFPAEARP